MTTSRSPCTAAKSSPCSARSGRAPTMSCARSPDCESAILLGLGQLYTNGRTMTGQGNAALFDSNLLGFLPFQVLVFMVVTACLYIWHKYSVTGRSITLVGLNHHRRDRHDPSPAPQRGQGAAGSSDSTEARRSGPVGARPSADPSRSRCAGPARGGRRRATPPTAPTRGGYPPTATRQGHRTARRQRPCRLRTDLPKTWVKSTTCPSTAVGGSPTSSRCSRTCSPTSGSAPRPMR